MCKRPLKGFQYGLTDAGKPNYIICSYDVDHIYIDSQGHINRCYEKPLVYHDSLITDFQEIPCGQCIECRLARSRQWADRCVLEQQYHDYSYFVTLTYDDDHLPTSEYITDDGEILENATLVPSDLSKFLKALRQAYAKKYDNKLRFFGCGEYGSETLRPHFHVIIFGLRLDDLVVYRRNFNGDILYNSEFLQSVWKKGYVVVGDCTWQSAAYVARYIMKKHLGKDSDFYEKYNIAPEFVRMSRRPGIAYQYYVDHPEIMMYDYVSVPTPQGGKQIYPPKYFERLYDIDYPSDSELRKDKKKRLMEYKKQIKLSKTDMNYIDMLQVEEYNLTKRLEKLPRVEI